MARHQLAKHAAAAEDLQAMLAGEAPAAEKADGRYVLGLCQLALEQHSAAAETFRALLKEQPQYAGADNVQYQLAWALKLSNDADGAALAFQQLTVKHPRSPRIAEAQFHVAEFNYGKKDYKMAADLYYAAVQKAGKSELAEKAGHKLGWAYYHLGDYDRAGKTFYYQQMAYPQGPLAGDAAFMEGECYFKQGRFSDAMAAYAKCGDLENKEFQALSLLHAAQAAAQLKQWEESLKLVTRCVEQFPESAHAPEALYEQGWAQQNLGRLDEAMKCYEATVAKTDREVAARAQFMIGEIQFQRKDHADAVKSFFKVLYGYGYPKWQSEAAYEAARCFEVLAKKTQAIKVYQELIDKFPESDKATLARQRLAELQKS
jgi:TolA-binding protein